MYITINSLITIFVLCFITRVQSNCYDDAPPAVDEQSFGEGMCCYFAFDWGISTAFVRGYAPSAQYYSKAFLPKHKLAFAEGKIPPNDVYGTIVEDPNSTLEGVAWLMTTADYTSYLQQDTIRECDGKRFGYAVTESVKVTRNGQEKYINCNAFVSAGLPLKTPCKSDIETLTKTFTAAHFTQEYINTFSQTPSNQCG